MTSSVSICSNALLLLGDKPISSLDEENDRARLASNLYPMARDATLRMHPWNCAKKRVLMAPLSNPPAFGWGYQFQLPADWLRIVQVGNQMFGADEKMNFAVEGQVLLSNANSVPLIYIYKNYVEATWDGMLIEAMTIAMAAAMAYGITKSTSLQGTYEAKLQAFLKTTRAVNGQDNPPETLGDFPLLDARLTGSGPALGIRNFAPGR